MPLIECPVCGAEIDSEAYECWECGIQREWEVPAAKPMATKIMIIREREGATSSRGALRRHGRGGSRCGVAPRSGRAAGGCPGQFFRPHKRALAKRSDRRAPVHLRVRIEERRWQ